MSKFFVISPSASSEFMRAALVRASGVVFDGRFEKRLLRGEAPPPPDLSCVVTTGEKVPDFLGNARRLCVVSPRVADALRSFGAKGVEFFPVAVMTPDGVGRRFEGLCVRGRGELHVEKSGATMELQTGLRVRAAIGVGSYHIDEEKWDGSDVFITPDTPMLPFWSDRAARVVEGLGPIGVEISPANAYSP
jgi:hypothetical protein